MAYYPFASENGAFYTLANPYNNAVAVFNDSTAVSNVGSITDIAGLDSPEVRESAEDLVQADGGTHGYFYFSRRPIVITATVFGHASVAERALKVDLADRAAQLLRTDGTLTWKPCNRNENLVWNPKATVDLTNHSTSATTGLTITRVTANLPTGWTTGFQATGTVNTTTVSALSSAGWTGTNGNGIPVIGGQRVSGGVDMKVQALTSGTISSIAVRVNWFKADGTGASTTLTTLSTQNSPVVGTSYSLEGTATAPSDAAYMAIRPIVNHSNPATFTVTYSGFKAAISSSVKPYVDGDMAGYFWNGNANASISGDYIEMFTVVRRNGPFRQTGGWVKELNIPLVSEYATVQGTGQKSVSAAGGSGVSTENRGSWDAYPIFRIAGASASNPTITNNTTGEVLRTTGTLLVASGETLEIDTLNHTAYFTSGARNGQSANRFIDFNLTQWPEMRSGSNTYTLSGTGTLTVLWRDTWV